ncbi:hypothetical protein Tco_0298365 [Tanacetum coccineum]
MSPDEAAIEDSLSTTFRRGVCGDTYFDIRIISLDNSDVATTATQNSTHSSDEYKGAELLFCDLETIAVFREFSGHWGGTTMTHTSDRVVWCVGGLLSGLKVGRVSIRCIDVEGFDMECGSVHCVGANGDLGGLTISGLSCVYEEYSVGCDSGTALLRGLSDYTMCLSDISLLSGEILRVSCYAMKWVGRTAILASSSEVPSVLEFLQRRKLEAKKEVAASEFSHLNHSLSHRPVSVKPDISKPDISKASSAGGKLHILKPSCERNGITPTPKESLSPTSGSKVPNSPLTGESNLLIVKASAD